MYNKQWSHFSIGHSFSLLKIVILPFLEQLLQRRLQLVPQPAQQVIRFFNSIISINGDLIQKCYICSIYCLNRIHYGKHSVNCDHGSKHSCRRKVMHFAEGLINYIETQTFLLNYLYFIHLFNIGYWKFFIPFR